MKKTKNKQGSAYSMVTNFRNKRKKTNHKQQDRAILKYKITYLEKMLLIFDGKLFKIFPKTGRTVENGSTKNEKNTPEAMATKQLENNDSQLLVPSLRASLLDFENRSLALSSSK